MPSSPSPPTPALQLSGNTVSIPLQAGEPALHQGDSAGTAPGCVTVQSPMDPQAAKELAELITRDEKVTIIHGPVGVFRLATLSERRERLEEITIVEERAGVFSLATLLSERRERLAESSPPAPETKPIAPKP